ncbi:terpene cyclase [Naviculisporaceae sp. PSN 640]
MTISSYTDPRRNRADVQTQGLDGQPGTLIYIPDTLAHFPWPRSVNPHFEECKAESDAWIRSFRVFSPKAQKAFDRCDFSLLAAMAYPRLDKAGCRVVCDVMNLFFVIDDESDRADEYEARYQADCVMDALRNPYNPRPVGEWAGGRITQEFWQRALKTATPSCQKRYVDLFQYYMDGVVQQAIDRDQQHIRDVETYFALRRQTIGTAPSYGLLDMHFNIPDYMIQHPHVQHMSDLATDMISMCNDLYSYNKEQATGEADHNLITVVMHQFGLTLHEAYEWVGSYHDDVLEEFIDLYETLPWFPNESEATNQELREYVNGLGDWVRANERWSFEGGRYFGDKGMEVLKSRIVALLPQKVR